MRQILLSFVTAALLTTLCGGQKQADTRIEKFTSPDGMMTAVVRSERTPEATNESRVELLTREGKVSAGRDYTSPDGEHGYGVTKAAWTPDSKFFVYSLESSGGHQAWHSPVWFFSRGDRRIFSLDSALNDSVSNAQFLVSAPDNVTVKLFFSKQTRTVALHELRR